MTANEIRAEKISYDNAGDRTAEFFLREIAAQLAELNARLIEFGMALIPPGRV